MVIKIYIHGQLVLQAQIPAVPTHVEINNIDYKLVYEEDKDLLPDEPFLGNG